MNDPWLWVLPIMTAWLLLIRAPFVWIARKRGEDDPNVWALLGATPFLLFIYWLVAESAGRYLGIWPWP
jgi:hypothetical protein